MTPASRKAKGRRLQQKVCSDLLGIAGSSLVAEDITSRIMGCAGEDVVLSPAAKKVFNLRVECKNCENLNVTGVFWKHHEKYPVEGGNPVIGGLNLLVHSRNRTEPLVTLQWSDFLQLLGSVVKDRPNE